MTVLSMLPKTEKVSNRKEQNPKKAQGWVKEYKKKIINVDNGNEDYISQNPGSSGRWSITSEQLTRMDLREERTQKYLNYGWKMMMPITLHTFWQNNENSKILRRNSSLRNSISQSRMFIKKKNHACRSSPSHLGATPS